MSNTGIKKRKEKATGMARIKTIGRNFNNKEPKN